MGQFIAILVSFMFIPLLIKRKVKLSYAILSTTLILGLLSRIGMQAIVRAFLGVFTDPASRDTILTVLVISILGEQMKRYKILDQIVETLLKIINNKKLILMMIPALIGILIIPGGAILSAPFIYNLGEEMKISKPRRSVINLVFRHVSMFLLPYSSTLLFIRAGFPEINIYKVILFNLIFVIGELFIAYVLYIKDIEVENNNKVENVVKNMGKLAILTTPIYVPVIINALTGLSFYLAMLVSLLLVYLIGDKKHFKKLKIKSLNWNTVLTVTSVLILKNIILNMTDMLGMVDGIFMKINNDILIMFILMLVSVFFGVITGYSTTGLAVTLPIVAMMNLPMDRLYVYIYFLIASAFIGYYFSPLHLCQVFTTEEMGVSTGDLYKEYGKFPVLLLILLMVSTVALLAIF